MDAVKEDLRKDGITWRDLIGCGRPQGKTGSDVSFFFVSFHWENKYNKKNNKKKIEKLHLSPCIRRVKKRSQWVCVGVKF